MSWKWHELFEQIISQTWCCGAAVAFLHLKFGVVYTMHVVCVDACKCVCLGIFCWNVMFTMLWSEVFLSMHVNRSWWLMLMCICWCFCDLFKSAACYFRFNNRPLAVCSFSLSLFYSLNHWLKFVHFHRIQQYVEPFWCDVWLLVELQPSLDSGHLNSPHVLVRIQMLLFFDVKRKRCERWKCSFMFASWIS